MKISGHSLILISTAYVKYLYQYVISNVYKKKQTGQFSGAEPVLILSKSRRFGFPAGRMSSSLASKASLWTGKVKIRKDRLQPKKLKLKKAGLRCTLSNCPGLSDTLSLEDLDS